MWSTLENVHAYKMFRQTEIEGEILWVSPHHLKAYILKPINSTLGNDTTRTLPTLVPYSVNLLQSRICIIPHHDQFFVTSMT